MDNYRHAVQVWKEELYGYEVGQVRADDIERVLVDLVDNGYSQRTAVSYTHLSHFRMVSGFSPASAAASAKVMPW